MHYNNDKYEGGQTKFASFPVTAEMLSLKFVTFSAFPEGCHFYLGPHFDECLLALWRRSNCLDSGYGNPLNYTTQQHNIINNFDLRYVFPIKKTM